MRACVCVCACVCVQELEATKQEHETIVNDFHTYQKTSEANLQSYKSLLDNYEREVKAGQSELEESGAILVDRLMQLSQLQHSIDKLSKDLKDAVLAKEAAETKAQQVESSAEKVRDEFRQELLVYASEKKSLENTCREAQLALEIVQEEMEVWKSLTIVSCSCFVASRRQFTSHEFT